MELSSECQTIKPMLGSNLIFHILAWFHRFIWSGTAELIPGDTLTQFITCSVLLPLRCSKKETLCSERCYRCIKKSASYLSYRYFLRRSWKVFEHTCAYAQWAHMHHFLFVCPSSTLPKFKWTKSHWTKIHTRQKVTRPKFILKTGMTGMIAWQQLPIAILGGNQ